ncbi:MAG: SGNH/GDSL hydrolase family protein, partial [Anaerolineae bacterium]|nr:SGNH/GDSL hydrolase family protein [Anaerolineae bacterium]
IMSLLKDVLLLDYAMRYDPDLIVWLVTAESFPADKQLFPPPVQNNPGPVRDLIAAYDLHIDPQDTRFVEPDFLGRTIVGQRRALADLLRLQLYAVPWAITGIDQYLPDDYTPRTEDFDEDLSWGEAFPEPQPLSEDDLAFEVLRAGLARAGDVPVLLVNEPMFVSAGINSELRYNFFYPRWAYDAYHALLDTAANEQGWHYVDLWDALPNEVYTDSPVHYTPDGAQMLAERVSAVVLELVGATE